MVPGYALTASDNVFTVTRETAGALTATLVFSPDDDSITRTTATSNRTAHTANFDVVPTVGTAMTPLSTMTTEQARTEINNLNGPGRFEFARVSTTGAYTLNVQNTTALTFYRGAYRTDLNVNGVVVYMIRRNVVDPMSGLVTTTWAGWNGTTILTETQLAALTYSTNMPIAVTS